MSNLKAIETVWKSQNEFPPPKVFLARNGGEDYAIIDDSHSVFTMMSSVRRGEQAFATASNNCKLEGDRYICSNLSVISCRTKSSYTPREMFVLKNIIHYLA